MSAALARIFQVLVLATGLLAGAAHAQGVNPDDLLPIEEAFRLSAVAADRDRIEISFEVADGYYLYRHRMDASTEGFEAGEVSWPEGVQHVDEFFGEVETYRQRVTGVLEGRAAPGLASVDLQVRYQGCADIGICYPPHRQQVTVELPASAAPANALVLPGVAPSALPGLPAQRIEVARALGDRLHGVRLDTGGQMVDRSVVSDMGHFDPRGVNPTLVWKVRLALDEAGFHHVTIVASGGFDAAKIRQFKQAGVPVDSYGVGSALLRGSFNFTDAIDQHGIEVRVLAIHLDARGIRPGRVDRADRHAGFAHPGRCVDGREIRDERGADGRAVGSATGLEHVRHDVFDALLGKHLLHEVAAGAGIVGFDRNEEMIDLIAGKLELGVVQRIDRDDAAHAFAR